MWLYVRSAGAILFVAGLCSEPTRVRILVNESVHKARHKQDVQKLKANETAVFAMGRDWVTGFVCVLVVCSERPTRNHDVVLNVRAFQVPHKHNVRALNARDTEKYVILTAMHRDGCLLLCFLVLVF